MPNWLRHRNDLMAIFNNARFWLRHYVHGYYAVNNSAMVSMPVNRLFFPLKNPNGGRNTIADSSDTHVLAFGRMYFIPAFLPVRFSLDSQLYFLSIHTNLDIFPNVELFSGCHRMLDIPSPPETSELMEVFDEPQDTSFFDALRIGSMVLSIMCRLLDFYSPKEFAVPLALKRFSSISNFLNQNATARTSVNELADIHGVSRENFTRKFTRVTGLTPKKIIDHFVARRCIDLIDAGGSFKEIAHQLKFSNEFAFSRYFKRVTGESPKNWCRKNGRRW